MAYTRFTYTFRIKKNGKAGKRLDSVPYTPLHECSLCGMVSTPKKVHERNDVYGWNYENENDFSEKSKSMLCMGCWNKVRPIVKAKREAQEIRRLTGKLYREALKWQKSQTQAN